MTQRATARVSPTGKGKRHASHTTHSGGTYSQNTSDGSTTAYTYDKADRLTQVEDSVTGTITRTYDNLDRLIQESTPQGTVNYTYDNAGRRTSMAVEAQPAVSYEYDNTNRLTQITRASVTAAIAYNTIGLRSTLTLPNAIGADYSYDAAAQPTGIVYSRQATALGDLTYEYDQAGNRTTVSRLARPNEPARPSNPNLRCRESGHRAGNRQSDPRCQRQSDQ